MEIKQWITSHPYLAGSTVIVGGVAILLVMRGGGGTAQQSTAGVSVAMAQLNTAASLEAMKIQAAQNVQSSQAAVANNQIQASLAALKLQTDAQTRQTQIGADATVALNRDKIGAVVSTATLQTQIYESMIQADKETSIAHDKLASDIASQQYTLAKYGVDLAKRDNRAKEGTNIVAMALGQGNINSYNSEQGIQAFSSAMMWGNILSSVSKFGSSLFGG
jgi:hypothetical protein